MTYTEYFRQVIRCRLRATRKHLRKNQKFSLAAFAEELNVPRNILCREFMDMGIDPKTGTNSAPEGVLPVPS